MVTPLVSKNLYGVQTEDFVTSKGIATLGSSHSPGMLRHFIYEGNEMTLPRSYDKARHDIVLQDMRELCE